MTTGRSTNQPGIPAPDSGGPLEPRRLLRYASVVGSVALAALLRVPLQPILGNKVAFITLFPAIVYSAWIAGFGGGLLATALSALIAAWFIIPPATSLLVAAPADHLSLFVFVLVGVAISALGQGQHQAHRRAEDSAFRAAQSALSAEQNAAVLRESEALLRDSEARKSAVLEVALDCIITADTQGRILEFNPAAERTFGYTRAEVVGRPIAETIVPPSLREAHMRGLAHYLATGDGPVLGQRVEVVGMRQGGEEFPVEIAIVPMGDGPSLGFTAYLRDLTERERNAAQQRAFLRDVLLSVTDGVLRLCHLPSELPESLPACSEDIAISKTGGMTELRAQARRAAADRGFADERGHDLTTASSEAAMNAAVHGGGGLGRVCGGADTIQVWVKDQGAGIDVASLPQATLEKGYSSAGTLGHGMKLMLAAADRVWLLTGPTGTTVVLEQDRLLRAAPWLRM